MKITPLSIATAMNVKKKMKDDHLPFAAFLTGLFQKDLQTGDEIIIIHRKAGVERRESVTVSSGDMEVLEKLKKAMW